MTARGTKKKDGEKAQAFNGRGRRPQSPAGQQTLEAGEPVKPRWMTELAEAYWDFYASLLVPNGLLTPLDGVAFLELCESAANIELLRIDLAKKRTRYRTNKNRTKTQYEEVGWLDDERKRFEKAEAKFGLTPKARDGMNIVVKPPAPKADARTERINSLLGRR